MRGVSELTDFYYNNLFPTLERLDADRKSLRKNIILVEIIYTLLAVGFLYNTSADSQDLVFIAYITLGGIIYKFMIRDYTHEFKTSIIQPLIHAIDSTLHYSPNAHISEHLFNRSDLFSKPDKISGNDLVMGSIGGINIEFSDIHAQRRNKSSKGRGSWSTIFQGLFIVAEFNKNFHGETVVLPDTAQNSFGNFIGNWLQSKNASREELVKMDDPEFEKEFVVYSTDQIEARYILSHSLMQKLLMFKNRSNHPLYISFIGNHIHMAVYYDKDLFEPSIFSSLLDYKVAMEYVKTLHLAISVVQELKLNQKLWSKR